MHMRLLAIDYGEKRIGLAITDEMQMFANPYETIPNASFDNTVSVLNKLVKEKKIGQIIIGIPWSINGNETAKTKETQEFMIKLQEHIDIPVIGSDERYTTSDANDLLKEMGYDWKKARKVIDSVAACLILKRYLERNAKHNK